MRQDGGMPRRRLLCLVLTLAYAVFIGLVTLTPAPFDDGVSGTIDRVLSFFARHPMSAWITFDRLEFIANIGMFVPLGALLVILLGRSRWWIAILLCLGYTVFIESFQAIVLAATRYATLSDVTANTLGGALGTGLGLLVLVWVGSRRRARPRAHVAEGTEA